MLSEDFRKAWPYEFGLVYSVTLTKGALETSLQVQNKGSQNFEFKTLLHTYLNVDVSLLPCFFDVGFRLLTLQGYLKRPYQEPPIQDLRRQDAERCISH